MNDKWNKILKETIKKYPNKSLKKIFKYTKKIYLKNKIHKKSKTISNK